LTVTTISSFPENITTGAVREAEIQAIYPSLKLFHGNSRPTTTGMAPGMQPRLRDILWNKDATSGAEDATDLQSGESHDAPTATSDPQPNVTTRSRLRPVADLLNGECSSSSDSSRKLTMRSRGRGLTPDSPVTLAPMLSNMTTQEDEASPLTERLKRRTKAPLAEVLNSMSPLASSKELDSSQVMNLTDSIPGPHSAHQIRRNPNADSVPLGKRKRNHDDSNRILPKPAPKKGNRRKQPALLPPLLAPLHDPPVDAKVVPSMNAEGFLSSLPEMQNSHAYAAGASGISKNPGSVNQTAVPDREHESEQHTHTSTIGHQTMKDPKEKDSREKDPRETGDDEEALDLAQHAGSGDEANQRTGGRTKRDPNRRLKWDKEETEFLIEGVARFGIGNWKKILECEDFHFHEGRNSIDLKDRFRTCFPDEYRSSGSQRGKVDSRIDSSGKRRGRGGRTIVELEKMGVTTEHVPFPKQGRRQRNAFTDEEDAALLRGFLKYPAQWKKIQMDPELGLEHRTRTDLRDRFRNRYPQRFKEAGYVHKAKQNSPPPDPTQSSNEPTTSATDDTGLNVMAPTSQLPSRTTDDLELSNLLSAPSEPFPPSVLLSLHNYKDDAHNLMPMLTSSYSEMYAYPTGPFGDDDDASEDNDNLIHLNTSIFEWADQNKRNTAAALIQSSQAAASASSVSNAPRDSSSNLLRIDPILTNIHPLDSMGKSMLQSEAATISSADQYEINPLLASGKLPSLASLMEDSSGADSASLSLARILNK
jgi:hypothetical protein